MPDAIVARILGLPGYGVYAWEAEEAASSLRLWVRPTGEPAYVCGGGGRVARAIHSWTERRVRDRPWGAWTVGLVVEVHRVRCRRCGVRTEQVPWLAGKAHYTTRVEAAVAQDCEHAPGSRVAARQVGAGAGDGPSDG
jgi:transposase